MKQNKSFLAIIVIIIILAIASALYFANPTGQSYLGLPVIESGAIETGISTSSTSCGTDDVTGAETVNCDITCDDGITTASIECTSVGGNTVSCDCSCKKKGSSPNDYWVAKCWCDY